VNAPAEWTIPAVRAALDARKISARELVKEFYARIEARMGNLTVSDLESLNGTFVNGQRVQSKTLKDGDVILTHSYSSSVIAILEKAHDQGRHLKVFVTETRPELEGRDVARELVAAGLNRNAPGRS
jgi:pSer/pThr/pTyr-binding forkhead associated (FHA) protein